ncbi:MAG: porin family protein [Prevotellaceae bacterium]|nr:porin family protein [Prevotellaceae bacterium]
MKKILLITLIAMLSIATANAQIAKGTTISLARVTGLDFSYASEEDQHLTQFELNAAVGYFVIDNLALVGQVGFAYSKWSDSESRSGFNFGLGARYYFVKTAYGQVGYAGQKVKDVDLANYVGLEIGYDIFISDNVFLEPAVYYAKGFSDVDKSSTFGLSFGIGIKF